MEPNARKTDGTDGSELRNTLEGTEHGKEAEKRNVQRRGERLGLSLCAVPSPRGMWGLSIYGRDKGLTRGLEAGL